MTIYTKELNDILSLYQVGLIACNKTRRQPLVQQKLYYAASTNRRKSSSRSTKALEQVFYS